MLGLLVIGLLSWRLPDIVGVPNLVGSSVGRPVSLVTSWAAAILAVHVGGEPSWQLYATAPRRVRLTNAFRICLVLLAGAGLGAALTDRWWQTAICSSALLGWGLIAGGVVGHRQAWSLPTVYLFSVLALGGSGGAGEVLWWDWILTETPGSQPALLSGAVAIIGLVVWWRSPVRQIRSLDQ